MAWYGYVCFFWPSVVCPEAVHAHKQGKPLGAEAFGDVKKEKKEDAGEEIFLSQLPEHAELRVQAGLAAQIDSYPS